MRDCVYENIGTISCKIWNFWLYIGKQNLALTGEV